MADIKLFFGRTEKVKHKEFYFDGLMMERISSIYQNQRIIHSKLGRITVK